MGNKKYTQKEVDDFIRAAITETAYGVMEWLEKETDIVDKETQVVLENAKLDIKPDRTGIMTTYVYPRLEKHGIKISQLN